MGNRRAWNTWGSVTAAALLWAASGTGASGAVCGDGILQAPETCDPPGPIGNCCTDHIGVGCSDPACTTSVCEYDSYCCSVKWDSICISEALTDPNCATGCGTCRPGCTFCGDGHIDPIENCEPPGPTGGSNCCAVHAGTGCSDPVCKAAVCAYDPYCCNVGWDATCAAEAIDEPYCVECEAPGLCDSLCLRDSDTDRQYDTVDPCPLGGGFFYQTIYATGKTQFGWNLPANIDWVKGQLNLVGSYSVIDFLSAGGTNVLAAPEVPAPGSGLYWLVRDDCNPTTWSSYGPGECYGPPLCAPGGRDGNLPLP